MALTQLPAPCKFERESNGHYYLWDGTFRSQSLIDLNEPQNGLGASVNTIFHNTLTPIVITASEDDEFAVFLSFLASRD